MDHEIAAGVKVYLGGLDENVRESEVRDFFRDSGPLDKIWIARNPPGYGFVTFEDPRDAKDACVELDGCDLAGRRVRVELATGRSSRRRSPGSRGGGGRSPYRGGGGSSDWGSGSSRSARHDDGFSSRGSDPRNQSVRDKDQIDRGVKVFLGNLSERTEKVDVEDFFRNAGRINKIWLARQPPGFGFVVFDDPRDAADAAADFDGREFLGRKVKVELAHGRGTGFRGRRDARRSRSFDRRDNGDSKGDNGDSKGGGGSKGASRSRSYDRRRRSRSRDRSRSRGRDRERSRERRSRSRSRSRRRSQEKDTKQRSRSREAQRNSRSRERSDKSKDMKDTRLKEERKDERAEK